MKVTKITYKRVFALPEYQNEQIGIEIDLQEGDKASDALEAAKKFVLGKSSSGVNQELERAKRIISSPKTSTVAEYEEAQGIIAKYADDDLPF